MVPLVLTSNGMGGTLPQDDFGPQPPNGFLATTLQEFTDAIVHVRGACALVDCCAYVCEGYVRMPACACLCVFVLWEVQASKCLGEAGWGRGPLCICVVMRLLLCVARGCGVVFAGCSHPYLSMHVRLCMHTCMRAMYADARARPCVGMHLWACTHVHLYAPVWYVR